MTRNVVIRSPLVKNDHQYQFATERKLMKRFVFGLVMMVALAGGVALAQVPGQGMGGARGAQPPATGPIADKVNAIIDALNKQDAAFFQKNVAPDALWLDEDGHMIPATL